MMKIRTLYLQMIFKKVVGNQSFFLLQPKLLTIWNPILVCHLKIQL